VLLNTRFNIQAVQWTDDSNDLPLRYLFGYYLASSALVLRDANGQLLAGEIAPSFIPISDQFSSSDSASGVRLPRGVGSSNELTLAVRVSDRLGATTTAFFGSDGQPVVVRVDPPVIADASAAIDLVAEQQEQLAQTLLEGDSARVLSDLSAMAEVLSIVPDDPCDAVVCSVGEVCYEGDCVDDGIEEEQNEEQQDDPIIVVAACPGSSPSREGQVDLSTGIVVLAPVSECSRNGVCVRTPSACAADATTGCQAVCNCGDGGQPNDPWAGSDCSRRQSDIEALQGKRQQLLEVQLQASEQLEGTEEAIAQHAATLGAMSSSTDSLDEDGQELALALAERLSSAALQGSDDEQDESSENAQPQGVSVGTAGQIMGVVGVLFESLQIGYSSAASGN